MVLVSVDLNLERGEIYARAISVSRENHTFAAIVRFTSVALEAYKHSGRRSRERTENP